MPSRYTQTSFASTKRRRRGKVAKYKRPTRALVPAILRTAFEQAHELKNIDLSVSANSGVLGIISPLTLIVQGTSGSNRTGRRIFVEKIELRLTMEQVSATGTGDIGRISLIMDRECKGAIFTAADLASNSTSISYLYNRDNVHRFKVLYDSGPRNVPVYTTNAGNSNFTVVTKTVKVGQTVHYYNASNAGTIADCEANSIALTFGTYLGGPLTAGTVRVYFRDV